MDQNCGTLVFVDLETGGPNPNRHPIIQLAAIAVDGRTLSTLEAIEIKIQFDETKANKYSLRKNGYSRKSWNDNALQETVAAKRFAGFLRKHAGFHALAKDGREFRLAQLVAHNAAFDGPFLQAWYKRLDIFLPARFQVFCTLQRALWHFFEHSEDGPPHDFKLGTLCKHFGVPLIGAHDALGDAQATVGFYRALLESPSASHAKKRRAA
jgi:DNA polymerase III epsilon subunit-like protein